MASSSCRTMQGPIAFFLGHKCFEYVAFQFNLVCYAMFHCIMRNDMARPISETRIIMYSCSPTLTPINLHIIPLNMSTSLLHSPGKNILTLSFRFLHPPHTSAFSNILCIVRFIWQLIPWYTYCKIKEHIWLQVLMDLLPELLFWQTYVMLVLLWYANEQK